MPVAPSAIWTASLVCAPPANAVHSKCIDLAPTIQIGHHHHPITLTYDIFQDNPAHTTIHNSCCGVCQREFKTEYGGYICASCSFVSHVDCVLPYVDRDIEVLEIINAERKEDETASGTAIKHSSHSHELILVDEEVSDEDDKRCSGCLLPILPPFYTCRECNFCVDKTCINLPQQWTDIDLYNLVLRPKATDLQICDIIRCFCCAQYIQIGFHYGYSGSGLSEIRGVDVRCVKFLMKTSGHMHKGHHHQLFYSIGRVDKEVPLLLCNACGQKCYHILRCEICDFNLDFRCATLPYKVINDRYDEHPLFLTYQQQDDGCDKYYCLICAKERDPNNWFYCCVICGFDAHPDCLVGKNPYVRLGSSDTFNGHPPPPTQFRGILRGR